MPAIEAEFKDSLRIEYRNVDDIENYKLLLSMEEKYQSKIRNILPVFYFEGHSRFLTEKHLDIVTKRGIIYFNLIK